MDIDINNMIFRVEDLTMERVMQELGISEKQRQEHPGLYKTFVEDCIPTRKDLEHKIDDEGLKELCLRLPCRVLMHRWNPVQDFIDQFTRQGRIQRWTDYKTKKVIVKAVRRHKDLYSDVDIRMAREREWCERKKENLMRLALWEYDRNQAARAQQSTATTGQQSEQEQPQTIEKDLEQQHTKTCQLQANEAARTELLNTTAEDQDDGAARRELLNNAAEDGENCVTDDEDVETTFSESMDSLVINEDIEHIAPIGNLSAHEPVSDENANQISFGKNIIASTVIAVETMTEPLHNTPVQSTPSDILPIPPLSQSNSAALNLTEFQNTAVPDIPNSQLGAKNTEELAGREYLELVEQHNSPVSKEAPLVDYVNVNTESMELADSTTISQDVLSDDECTPPYCEFNTHVSMTSTQSVD